MREINEKYANITIFTRNLPWNETSWLQEQTTIRFGGHKGWNYFIWKPCWCGNCIAVNMKHPSKPAASSLSKAFSLLGSRTASLWYSCLFPVLPEVCPALGTGFHQSMDYKSRRLEMTSMSVKRGPVDYVRNTKQPYNSTSAKKTHLQNIPCSEESRFKTA